MTAAPVFKVLGACPSADGAGVSVPEIVTTDMLLRHIDHMVDLVGIDHVGFGSDHIPDITWRANAIQSPMGRVVLPDGGYSEEDCGKFLGRNNYRVFEQVWT